MPVAGGSVSNGSLLIGLASESRRHQPSPDLQNAAICTDPADVERFKSVPEIESFI